MSEDQWCGTCKHEDKFKDSNELGIDEPYLCTKSAKTKKGLNGCKTVTLRKRAEIIKGTCKDWEAKI
jgi:hypothetical protein